MIGDFRTVSAEDQRRRLATSRVAKLMLIRMLQPTRSPIELQMDGENIFGLT